MKRYIALLRGINISGKNKIPMEKLKASFAELGFTDVLTYLNSGNVVFSTGESDAIALADKIQAVIQEQFEWNIPVFVILQETLRDLLNQKPAWWGSDAKETYDNLIFVIPPATAEIIAAQIGEPTEGLEQILLYQNVIFWTFDRTKYAKANWWKRTASTGIGEKLTIRTAHTLEKIATM